MYGLGDESTCNKCKSKCFKSFWTSWNHHHLSLDVPRKGPLAPGNAAIHAITTVQLSVGNLSDYTITARSILIEALRLRPVGPVWTGHVLQASARLFFCPSLFFFWHLSAFPANWCGIYLHNLIWLKFDSYFHSK